MYEMCTDERTKSNTYLCIQTNKQTNKHRFSDANRAQHLKLKAKEAHRNELHDGVEGGGGVWKKEARKSCKALQKKLNSLKRQKRSLCRSADTERRIKAYTVLEKILETRNNFEFIGES